jgi:hypothetical protein
MKRVSQVVSNSFPQDREAWDLEMNQRERYRGTGQRPACPTCTLVTPWTPWLVVEHAAVSQRETSFTDPINIC